MEMENARADNVTNVASATTHKNDDVTHGPQHPSSIASSGSRSHHSTWQSATSNVNGGFVSSTPSRASPTSRTHLGFPASPAVSTLSKNSSFSGGSSLASAAATKMSVDDILSCSKLSLTGRQRARRQAMLPRGRHSGDNAHRKATESWERRSKGLASGATSSRKNCHVTPAAATAASGGPRRRVPPRPAVRSNPGEAERKRRLEMRQQEHRTKLQKMLREEREEEWKGEERKRRRAEERAGEDTRGECRERLQKNHKSNESGSCKDGSMQRWPPGERDSRRLLSGEPAKPKKVSSADGAASNIVSMAESEARLKKTGETSEGPEKKARQPSKKRTPVRRSKRARTVTVSKNVAEKNMRPIVTTMVGSLPKEALPGDDGRQVSVAAAPSPLVEETSRGLSRGPSQEEMSLEPEEEKEEPESIETAIAALLAKHHECVHTAKSDIEREGEVTPWHVMQHLTIVLAFLSLRDPAYVEGEECRVAERGLARIVWSVSRVRQKVMHRRGAGGGRGIPR